MENRGVLLGIDYGLARVGLARTDETRTVVQGIARLNRSGDRKLAEAIAEQAVELAVTGFVIGLPLRDDDRETEVITGARRLGRHLVRITGLGVSFVDETLSSQEADAEGLRLGWGLDRIRRERDVLAAATILRRFLEEGGLPS